MINSNSPRESTKYALNLEDARLGRLALVGHHAPRQPPLTGPARASELTAAPPGAGPRAVGRCGPPRPARRPLGHVGRAGLWGLGALLVACAGEAPQDPDGSAPDGDASDPACHAQVYSGREFAGDGACLPVGPTSLAELKTLGLPEAVVGSVVLEPGFRLTVWTDGAAEPVQTATSDAALAVTGSVARVEVTPCLAGLFEGPDGHGAGACVGVGLHDATTLGLRPGRTRSLVVAAGYRATVVRAPGAPATTLEARGTLELSDEAGGAFVSLEVTPDDRSAIEPDVAAAAAVTKKAITSFQHVYVVGDSLSDQQNQRSSLVPRCPNQHLGYWNGRFTNGYNWVDYLTQDNAGLGATISNRAVGGAKVLVSAIVRPSLTAQANALIAALPSATRQAQLANSLVVIWGGANDLKETVTTRSPGDATAFGTRVLNELKVVEATLFNAGVRNFVFIGVPEINRVPVAAGWTTAQRLWASTAARTVNTGLVSFASSRGFVYVTVPAMINDWLDHRLVSVNMNDTTNACTTQGACDFTASGTYVEHVCAHKMFFDPLHPTSLAHCGVAQRIEQAMATKYTINGATASVESCGRRRQAVAFAGTPDRRIRFDVRTQLLTAGVAAQICPSTCTGAGARWNGNWDNPSLANPLPTPGGTFRVGVCGCDK